MLWGVFVNAMSKFVFEQIRPEGGDCTAPYNVKFYEKCTVRDFISEVLARKEWGSIGIWNPEENPFFGSPAITYRQDVLHGDFPDEIMDKRIKSATSHGGWSRMDYILVLD